MNAPGRLLAPGGELAWGLESNHSLDKLVAKLEAFDAAKVPQEDSQKAFTAPSGD